MGLKAKLAELNSDLDARLRGLVAATDSCDRYYNMMAYHLGWLNERFDIQDGNHGKRLRPCLCLLVHESLTGAVDKAVPAAMAVELVHNFSLVHDDIQDNSHHRRSRPTVWSVWGAPHAINVGDGLLALAYAALASHDLTPEHVCRGTRALSQAVMSLCEGQFLDMTLQAEPGLGLDRYRAMIARKTGALFGCAARLGALTADAPPHVEEGLHDFGRLLGEAFQMHDDVAGVWGDTKTTGKPARDIQERKCGLPAVIASARALGPDARRLIALYARSAPLEEDETHWVLDLFRRLEVREEAEATARETLRRAEKALDEVAPPGTASESLRDLLSLIRAQG
ncbi:MAG: polyprenyl synthetase family protein [Micromonosporaceae bacterium]|nr:polyprenyl synthetase family protein [Micromonosporaceae bacterium]